VAVKEYDLSHFIDMDLSQNFLFSLVGNNMSENISESFQNMKNEVLIIMTEIQIMVRMKTSPNIVSILEIVID
jgi:hypothetical protein